MTYKTYNKIIKPKKCWVHKLNPIAIVFNEQLDSSWMKCDSELEAKTYIKLRTSFDANQIIKDYPLLIKPPTTNYKQIVWKCDFAIQSHADNNVLYFVESKGLATEKFNLQIQLLEYFCYEDWSKLLIVSNNSKLKIPGKPVFKLNELLPHIAKQNVL